MDTNITIIEKIDNLEKLKTFFVSKIKMTLWEIAFWPFSKIWRLKYAFYSEIKNGFDPKKFIKLKMLASNTSFELIRDNRPEQKLLLLDVLIYIFHIHLFKQSIFETITIYNRIVKQAKETEIILILRLKLLDMLLSNDSSNSNIDNLLLSLISDKRNKEFFQNQIILNAIISIYSLKGAKFCLQIIEKSCSEFKRISLTKDIVSLCNCPILFDNLKNALKWGGVINPENYSFSIEMKRNAFLINAKVSEWKGDFVSMNKFASKACELDNGSLDANYWLIRSLMRSSEKLPPLSNIEMFYGTNEQWKRICVAIDLRKRRDYKSIESVILVLQSNIDNPDKQESNLFVDLIKRALKPSLERSNDEQRVNAELSEKIRNLNSGLGWATTNVTLNLLINSNDSKNAYKEIHKPECDGEELAQILRPITEFLSDENYSLKNLPDFIRTMKRARDCLIINKELNQGALTELRKNLESHKNENWITIIPLLRDSLDALIKLLALLEGNDTVLNDLVQIADESNVVPGWIKWIVLRFVLINAECNYPFNSNLFTSLKNSNQSLAILSWLACYASPKILKNHQKDILDSPNASFYIKFLNIYGWNESLTNYNIDSNVNYSFENIVKSLFSMNEIGQTIKELVKNDIVISSKIYNSRINASKGLVLQAKNEFEKLLNYVQHHCITIKYWWESYIIYWLSVIQAQLENDNEAIAGFNSLLEGPKASEARAQLSLLFIRKYKFQEANKILDKTDIQFPNVLYVKALLAWRNNDHEGAERIIKEFISNFGAEYKHYYNACIRLLALIDECKDKNDTAIKLLISLTSEEMNEDRIVAIRLLRILTRQTFIEYKDHYLNESTIIERVKIINSIFKYIPKSVREYNCKILYNLLTDNELNKDKLLSLENQIPLNFAMYQTYILKLLKYNEFKTILKLLEKVSQINKYTKNQPLYFKKTLFSFWSWNFITLFWKSYAPNYALEKDNDNLKLKIIKDLLPEIYSSFELTNKDDNFMNEFLNSVIIDYFKDDNSEFKYKDTLVEAAKIAEAIINSSNINPELIEKSENFKLLIKINSINSNTVKDDKKALAKEIISICQTNGNNLTESQQNSALALAYWYINDYKNFFACIKNIIYDKIIPIDEEDVWLAQAYIWYKTEQYYQIFENEMPEKIAELSNPDACILMAKASSRLALKSWESNKTREAVNYINQSASTLKSLNLLDTNN